LAEGIADLFELERLDDGNDEFHAFPLELCRPYRRYAEKLSDSFAVRTGGEAKLWADQDSTAVLSREQIDGA